MISQRDPSLVVVQLSGGNDAMNTVVPYTDGIYHDSRSAIRTRSWTAHSSSST